MKNMQYFYLLPIFIYDDKERKIYNSALHKVR